MTHPTKLYPVSVRCVDEYTFNALGVIVRLNVLYISKKAFLF